MGEISSRVREFLAGRHGSQPFSIIATAAEKYLRSYNNVSNWNFERNGESRILSLLLAKLDGAIIDVGANHGDWSLAALNFARPDALIYCFEIVPDLRAILEETLRSHEGRVKISELGLGSSDDKTEVINFDPRSHTISSKFDLIYKDTSPKQITVKTTTGDAYCAANGVGTIAFLKIDVEGMEMEVLQGFDGKFASASVRAVQFEHGPSHVLSGHTLRNFVEFFKDRGFSVYEIFPHKLMKMDYDFSKEIYDGRNF